MIAAPAIITLIVAVVAVTIGLFVFLNNRHGKVNQLTFALTVVASVSLMAQNIGELYDLQHVVFWARTDSGLSIVGDTLLLLLVCNFPRQLFSRRTEVIYGIISVIMIVLSITPYMIASGTSSGGVVSLETGSLMPLYYVADTIYTVLVIPALFVQYRRGREIDKLRVLYLLIGGGILGLAISILGLWLPIFFHVYRAVDYVPLVALVALLLLAYDIVALRLFSIRLIVARSVAYLFLLLFIAGGYYVIALQLGHLLFNVQLNETTQIYQIMVALGLALIFQPLRRVFEKATNRIFYREHYDTQRVIDGFSNILVVEQKIDPLLQQSLTFLCDQLHVSWGGVAVYSKGRLFASATHHTKKDLRPMVAFLEQQPKNVIIAAELPDQDPIRLMMDTHAVQGAVKLVSQNEYIGMLFLGNKLSGDIYSGQDIGVLEIIQQELAVAIQNARAYRQLQIAEAKLRQTDKIKSEFIALSSHNLRTPITSLKLIADALDTSHLPPESHQYVTMLTKVAGDLGDFVEELLTISTLEAGGGQYASILKNVSIEEIIAPLAEQANKDAKAKNLAFELTFHQKGILLKANPKHLKITLHNIISNALKFTEKGRITISVAKEGDYCCIKIADTGVGIAPHELKNLFTKFHRGTSYMTYDYTGAGVGLYLVKLIIEEHGGRINVKSRLHVGTTVTIYLPLA